MQQGPAARHPKKGLISNLAMKEQNPLQAMVL
jgi:hypothetical protein